MANAISMRELQKMSAGAIQALPHAMPIKAGSATVGVLIPISKVAPDYFARIVDQIAADRAKDTPDERAAIEALAKERGIDWE